MLPLLDISRGKERFVFFNPVDREPFQIIDKALD
jgi:hypothetical protein